MTKEQTSWRAIFPALAESDLQTQSLLDSGRLVTLPQNEPVFCAHSPCNNYLLVLKGSIRVQVIGASGREVVLYRVLPGQSCVLTTCCIISGNDYPAEGFTVRDSGVRPYN